VLRGRFTAVAVLGQAETAGAWADGLFTSDDSGASWSRAQVPAGDTEFEALMAKGYAGTLLGVLRSVDGAGLEWTRVPGLPDRVTALDYDGANGLVRVGDWRGSVWNYSPDTGLVARSASYPGGIESLAGGVTATTGGPYPRRAGPLDGREVTRVVATTDGYFAAAARGPIYFSAGGGDWTFAYQG